MSEARRRAIEAAFDTVNANDECYVAWLGDAERLIRAYESAMLEAGWKMTPREATDEMVRAESDRMSAPTCYLKRKWAAIWDEAPKP